MSAPVTGHALSDASPDRRLIYFIGPSGAGKDSLLAWLAGHLPADFPVHWSRRTIDRPRHGEGGEAHEAVDTQTFDALRASGAFRLHWQANSHSYGIRREELAPLAQGQWVFVNGSRAYLPQAKQACPGLRTVLITASPEVLRDRLVARGREDAAAIAARLARLREEPDVEADLVVRNDGSLGDSGQRLLGWLMQEHQKELHP
jgi:ribose 1,5-bisphosphokinase